MRRGRCFLRRLLPTCAWKLHSGRLLLAAIPLLLTRPALAQDESAVDSERNELVEALDPVSEFIPEEDLLSVLLDDPVDLNTAGVDQLLTLPGMTRHLAESIVSYRSEQGRFLSVATLADVPGFTPIVVDGLRPFITAGGRPKRANARARFSQRLHRRLDVGRGYRTTHSDSSAAYAGGPWSSTMRLGIEYSDWFSAFVTADHDAGEQIVWKPSAARFGPDFLSWSVAVNPRNVLRTIVLGDFTYSSRLGLAVGAAGFASFDRPARAVSPESVRAFSGTIESSRFRGFGADLSWHNITLTVVASRRKRDADIDTAAAGGAYATIASGGDYHRTNSEVSRRHVIGERLAAVRLGIHSGHLDVGLTALAVTFSDSVGTGERPDQLLNFEGFRQSLLSLDALAEIGSNRCSLEISLAPGRSPSAVGLCEMNLSRSSRTWVYGRWLTVHSNSLVGSPLKRSGSQAGEGGISLGWRWRPWPRTSVVAYGDAWWHPWLRYLIWTRSTGREAGVRITRKAAGYSASLKLTSTVRDTGSETIDHAGRIIRTSEKRSAVRLASRCTLELHESTDVVIASSVSAARRQREPRRVGTMLSAALRYRRTSGVDLATGIAVYSSPVADTRIYAYEPDVRFGFGSVSYSGSGERWYLLVSARPTSSLTIQFKFSAVSRYGARSAGSGLDEVDGTRIRDVSFQVILEL